MKNYLLLLSILAILIFGACKKDLITVNEEKIFIEEDFKPSNFPYDAGWQLTLAPNGMANIIPSGDIVYRGTYKINGKTIKVKTDQGTFDFTILSADRIKENSSGITLVAQTK